MLWANTVSSSMIRIFITGVGAVLHSDALPKINAKFWRDSVGQSCRNCGDILDRLCGKNVFVSYLLSNNYRIVTLSLYLLGPAI
jgi:hypothetical protein